MNYYRKKRTNVNMKKSDIANKLGITYDRYLQIERGKVKMPKDLINKFNEITNISTAEYKIDKLEREQIVNDWYNEMIPTDENGNRKLDNKLKEFNIKSYRELSRLLGYGETTNVLTFFKKERGYDFKNKLYSFFENELNIQVPKTKRGKTTICNRNKEIYDWYYNFDFKEWLKDNNLSTYELVTLTGLSQASVNRYVRHSVTTPRIDNLQLLKDFIDNNSNVNVSDTVNTVYNDENKVNKEEIVEEHNRLLDLSMKYLKKKCDIEDKVVKNNYKIQQIQEELNNLIEETKSLKASIIGYEEIIEDLEVLGNG